MSVKPILLALLFTVLSATGYAQTDEVYTDAAYADQNGSDWLYVLTLILLIGATVVTLYYMGVILWIRAKMSNVKIGLYQLVLMRLKKVSPQKVIHEMIKAAEAGIHIPYYKLVSHVLAGGSISKTVDAVISAKNADAELEGEQKLNLDFDTAANIDLADYDVAKAVHDAIHYRVAETEPVRAFALDGIELTMKCKVTMRPRIKRIVGGVSSATVLARVNEAVVTAIGNTPTHLEVLRSPYLIAEKVLSQKNLFVDTAYDVFSIDISDIEIGKDIHAELEVERARARKETAEAERHEAVTMEQKMRAKAEEARVRVLEAEREVQRAMAAAFLEGTIDIQKYHEIQNTIADTKMRESISKSVKNENT